MMIGVSEGGYDDEMSESDKKMYGDAESKYRAKCDFKALMVADEIRKDKERFKMAMDFAKEYRDKISGAIKESKSE